MVDTGYVDLSDKPLPDMTAPLRPPRTVEPLEYAPPKPRRAPIDWLAGARQVVFAFGIGSVAGGIVDVWGGSAAWHDNGVLWVGFGAALAALALPWPGGFRRRA